MYLMEERRHEPRYSVTEEAVVWTGGDVQAALIEDVSKSGVRVRTECALSCGNDVTVNLRGLVVCGTVQHSYPEGNTHVAGIQIDLVKDSLTNALSANESLRILERAGRAAPSLDELLDDVLAGTNADELQPRVVHLNPSVRQAFLCSICKMHNEVASNCVQHGAEIKTLLELECPLFVDGRATCLGDW